jgi:DNA repair protein RecO (recombination protein O)
MASYTTNAINLKSYNLSESDKIIVMYSREHGLIRCVAKGSRKPASKIGGMMDLLIANKLMLAKGKNLDIVCQAEGVDAFKHIRKDINKLTYAMYCAELVSNFGMENDTNSSKIYDLLFETFKNTGLAANNAEIIWTVVKFQLKLMEYLGYAVELDTCVRCNEQINNNMYQFCPDSGGIICSKCRSTAGNVIDINHGLRQILKEAQSYDFAISANEIEVAFCFKILKEYVSLRSGKKIKTSELIECLC